MRLNQSLTTLLFQISPVPSTTARAQKFSLPSPQSPATVKLPDALFLPLGFSCAPSITTAPTRAGLTYTFSEGTTLTGMTQKATKVGDGTTWTPTITVKGGTSGFYAIGVTK